MKTKKLMKHHAGVEDDDEDGDEVATDERDRVQINSRIIA